MSNSSSPTPTPPPSPLTIGRTFLKQYYNVLTTTPDMIYKFYRPSSVLSHGEGSNPTTPVTLESLGKNPATELKDRFFSWSSKSVRFELEHGAIDAQESVGGGVLLVVTGHLYLGSGKSRKPFCHTFFLHVIDSNSNKKRQYYVHNDVLRFLQEEAPSSSPMDNPDAVLTSVDEEEEVAVAEKTTVTEEPPVAVTVAVAPVEEPPVTAPAAVVEEVAVTKTEQVVTKEAAKEEPKEEVSKAVAAEPAADAAPPVVVAKAEAPAEVVEGYQEGVEESKEDFADAQEAPAKKSAPPPAAKPSSWASLVATSAAAPVKQAPPPVHKKKSASKTTDNSKAANNNSSSSSSNKEDHKPAKKEKKESDGHGSKTDKPQRSSGRRDPDCTLVIKHVPDGTNEQNVRTLFEPFATATNTKIVGITVSQRGLAFVDYDSAAPVLRALAQKEKFTLMGKAVDIDQKTNDNRNRGGRGGNNNNNSNNKSNGGGQRSGGGGSSSNNQRQRNNNSGGRSGGGRSGKGGGGGAGANSSGGGAR